MTIHTVTGAFGYSGKYITERLLKNGVTVRTLTNSPNRSNAFDEKISASPLDFNDVENLANSLLGTEVLYNTYWVRFNHRSFSHQDAVANTLALFRAAQMAGVRRIVHVSITNPTQSSSLEYFRGKAQLEKALIETGLSYSILRPAVLFGNEDILVNNIAWVLRRLPIFGVFGDGKYRLQPIHVEDFADPAVLQGLRSDDSIVNAIGPETYTYRELVSTIGSAIGIKPRIISVPPFLGYFASQLIGKIVNDVFVTREEIEGLMQDPLYVNDASIGNVKLSTWAQQNSNTLGMKYSSELGRRRDRCKAYSEL